MHVACASHKVVQGRGSCNRAGALLHTLAVFNAAVASPGHPHLVRALERMGDATFWELAIGTSWSRALPQLSIPGRLEARDGQCTEWAFLFRTVLCYSYNYPLLI
jgi:hypothetical protein